MAPGRKRDLRKEKKKNANFSVGNKARAVESIQSSSKKKSKDKHQNKRKLKEKTSQWIEDVDKSFSTLQPKLVDNNLKSEDKASELKSANLKDMDNQKLKSDITEADINNTITNMASLLEQS